MEDILSLIVTTERQINETLRKERLRLEAWVEEEKRKIDKEIGEKKIELGKEADLLKKTIEEAARKKASSMIEEARDFACRMEGLDEDYLKEIVNRYLERLIK